jgi:hypothetical protein
MCVYVCAFVTVAMEQRLCSEYLLVAIIDVWVAFGHLVCYQSLCAHLLKPHSLACCVLAVLAERRSVTPRSKQASRPTFEIPPLEELLF